MADVRLLVLRVDADLVPAWPDEIRRIAATFVRRMAVIEKPDEWIVHCELDPDRVDAFHEALQAAWDAFRDPPPESP